jgi:hypothetical protein
VEHILSKVEGHSHNVVSDLFSSSSLFLFSLNPPTLLLLDLSQHSPFEGKREGLLYPRPEFIYNNWIAV